MLVYYDSKSSWGWWDELKYWTGGRTSPCSLLTRVCSPCSSCSFSSRDSSSSSTLSWLSSRSFCCRCSVAVACVETCRASASWKHTQPYCKHTCRYLNVIYTREKSKKSFSSKVKRQCFCTSVSSLKMVLLSSDVFLSLVSLCTSSSSSCLSVIHNFSDRVWACCVCFSRFSWTQHNTHSSKVYTVSYTCVSYCPLKVSKVWIKISLSSHSSIHPSSWLELLLCDWVYLSVLDLVLKGLLEEIEGVLLSVGLHHNVPGRLHLDLHRTRKQLIVQTHGQLQYHASIHPSSHTHLHRSIFLAHGLDLSLHLYHLLPHPLHLVGQLSVGPQQVLVVHQ